MVSNPASFSRAGQAKRPAQQASRPRKTPGAAVDNGQQRARAPERDRLPLECGKGGVAAQQTRDKKRLQVRIRQSLAVERDQQQADEERAGDVDKQGAEGEVVAELSAGRAADQISHHRSDRAPEGDKQTAFEQVSILAQGSSVAARTPAATLSG